MEAAAALARPVRLLQGPVLGALAKVEQARTYGGTLRRGKVKKAQARRARRSWWGSDLRWYPGGTPPRIHNRITPMIDGESYFTALLEALREAHDYIYIIGWCMTPRIPLGRDGQEDLVDTQLLALLSEAASRIPVRILLWSGAPLLLQPTRRSVEAVKAVIDREVKGNIEVRLDTSARWSHCHHQKAVVIDGRM